MLNKEDLQERINKIKEEMEKTKAHFSMLEGHLSESMHWLTEFEKKENECTE